MIDSETAREGAGLIAAAITELAEHVHEESVRMHRGDLAAVVGGVDGLRSAAADVAALTEALAVLARWSGEGAGGHG